MQKRSLGLARALALAAVLAIFAAVWLASDRIFAAFGVTGSEGQNLMYSGVFMGGVALYKWLASLKSPAAGDLGSCLLLAGIGTVAFVAGIVVGSESMF